MILSDDEKPYQFKIQTIIFNFLSTIFVAISISIGLVASTQVSGYHLQNVYLPVDKEHCTCDCWDGFFRGTYGRGHYKILYFNYEKPIIILLALFLFYTELLRQFVLNLILKKQLILVLLIPAVYSNFYGVWSIINYINDFDYDRMLKSQIFFSLTELIATYLFYQYLINKNYSQLPIWCIYLLCTISCLHIIIALGELDIRQMARNIAIVLSDFVSLGWITMMLVKNHRLRPNMRTIYKWLFIAFCLWLFYNFVCPFRE